ncbi:hypothetical protein [Urechidicola vernalis]|uniref:Uncharacterized protein n=1 Tax=Urechidicola vernalis TaxID=3075600 RepID=A0ABU2Y605_9FLAO|nr:hypothetical protein [Urechidicola sp. P050]MDT0553638.1 hypothetical protein [Urechidicola sp. P050]
MSITKSHIKELYQFTSAHFVEHYDVQTELVDHLANDIEAIWENQPSLSFEQARDQSFKKFGVFGFMGVVEEKQKQISKKYWRLVWSVFKGFFKLPQIIVTATICIGIYTLLQLVNQEWVFAVIGFGGASLMIFRAFQIKKHMKVGFEKTKKKWMLEEHIYGFGNFVGLFNLLIQFVFIMDPVSSNFLIFLIAIFLTVFSLTIYITAFILPSNMETFLEKEYPEYKSVTI